MRQRLDYIDGLRGLAASLVVAQHALENIQFGGNTQYRALTDYVNWGRFGVVLFFLISGAVIPFSFGGASPIRNFAVSRFFRLYPAYWLSLPLVVLASIHFGGRVYSADIYIANLSMLQGLWGFPDVSGPYWTLKFEILFYVLCAVLFWRGRLESPHVIGALALAFSIVAMAADLSGRHGLTAKLPLWMLMFALGMLIRQAFVGENRTAKQWLAVLVPLAVVAGLVFGGTFYRIPDNSDRFLTPIATSAGNILPIFLFIIILWAKPVFGAPILYLGKISYSLYLFQAIGLLIVAALIAPQQWPVGYLLAVLAISVALASLTYRYVEKPAIDMGRSLARRHQSASMPV